MPSCTGISRASRTGSPGGDLGSLATVTVTKSSQLAILSYGSHSHGRRRPGRFANTFIDTLKEDTGATSTAKVSICMNNHKDWISRQKAWMRPPWWWCWWWAVFYDSPVLKLLILNCVRKYKLCRFDFFMFWVPVPFFVFLISTCMQAALVDNLRILAVNLVRSINSGTQPVLIEDKLRKYFS